jgi:hypothetical protein
MKFILIRSWFSRWRARWRAAKRQLETRAWKALRPSGRRAGQANNSEYLLKNYGRNDPGRIFTEGVSSSQNNQRVTKPRACPPGTRQEQLPPT